MVRAVALLAVVALAGCGFLTTREEVMANGPTTEHQLKLDALQASGCISRNAENFTDGLTAPIRPGVKPGTLEVFIRIVGSVQPILLIVDIEPSPPGTRAFVHGRGFTGGHTREDFVAAVIKGC